MFFLQLMLRHHEGGVAMAEAGATGHTVAVRNLADKIVVGQRHEIRVITDMLAERGSAPLP